MKLHKTANPALGHRSGAKPNLSPNQCTTKTYQTPFTENSATD